MSKLVALDLGGSACRVKTSTGVTVFEPESREISDTTFNDFSRNATSEIQVLESPISCTVGKRYAKGESINSYEGRILSCDNQHFKSHQESTYVNYIFSVARSLLWINQEEWKSLKLGLCLPAKECYSTEVNTFITTLTGKYKVKFPRTAREVCWEITKDNFIVAAEGGSAVTQLLMSNKDTRYLMQSNVVLIDVGYRSTEIIFYCNGRTIFKTVMSEPYGGITIGAYIDSALTKAGIVGADIESAIKTGYITRNGKVFSTISLLNSAKEMLALSIRNSVAKYSGITDGIRNISNLQHAVLMGRLFNETKYKEETSNFADMVLKALDVSPKKSIVLCKGNENVEATYFLMQTKYKD